MATDGSSKPANDAIGNVNWFLENTWQQKEAFRRGASLICDDT